MKKYIAILLVMCPFIYLQAQREYLPTAEDLNHFSTTKTYVVLESNPLSDYNLEIQDAVKKYWKITEYEFISFDEFGDKSVDKNASFLYVAAVNFEKDKSRTRYMFLCLSMGGPDHDNIDELKDITNLPLSYHGVDEDLYTYKLGTLLRFMQNHVTLLISDPALVSQNSFQYYNKHMGDLSKKTVYFVEDEVEQALSSEAKIKEIYPYPFKIVEREEIKELIMANDEDAVILHKVGPEGKNLEARVYKALIGVSDAQFYYYNYHKASAKKPDAFIMNDFKRISKAPKSK